MRYNNKLYGAEYFSERKGGCHPGWGGAVHEAEIPEIFFLLCQVEGLKITKQGISHTKQKMVIYY